MDRHVGHRLPEPCDALRRRNQREEQDSGNARGPEDFAGADRRATGGEHRIDHDRHAGAAVGRQFVVVLLRPERGLVAVQPDVPDLGFGNQLQEPLGHAEAGTEDRHDRDPLGDPPPLRLAQRGGHTHLKSGYGRRSLHGEQPRDLPDRPAKLGRAGRWIAQGDHMVRDQGMRRYLGSRHAVQSFCSRSPDHTAGKRLVERAAETSGQ